MSGWGGGITTAGAVLVIALNIFTTARKVAKHTQPDAPFPYTDVVWAATFSWWTPGDIARHDWALVAMNITIVAMSLRIIWHWWRRRRKGKPSRVLGLVRSLGHRLTVVAVPVEDGAR